MSAPFNANPPGARPPASASGALHAALETRIENMDIAREQVELVRMQILQQTGSAFAAQANAALPAILSFL